MGRAEHNYVPDWSERELTREYLDRRGLELEEQEKDLDRVEDEDVERFYKGDMSHG